MELDYINATSTYGKFLEKCLVKNAKFDFVIVFPSTKYFINHVICCVVNALLTFTTIFLNTLTLLAYWKSLQLKKKPSYFLVMLLSANDIGVGFFSNSTFTVRLLLEIFGSGNCFWPMLCRTLTLGLSGMSLMTLFILNMERYLSIMHPVFHRNKITKQKLVIAAVILWFCSAMGSGFHFINEGIGGILTLFAITIVLVTVTLIYTKIFCTIRGASVNASPVNRNLGQNPEILSTLNRKRFLQKVRQAKSCLVVVICTFFCFLPTIITSSLKKGSFSVIVLKLWSMTFILMASALNSIIFFWKNQILRNEAKKVLYLVFNFSKT